MVHTVNLLSGVWTLTISHISLHRMHWTVIFFCLTIFMNDFAFASQHQHFMRHTHQRFTVNKCYLYVDQVYGIVSWYPYICWEICELISQSLPCIQRNRTFVWEKLEMHCNSTTCSECSCKVRMSLQDNMHCKV